MTDRMIAITSLKRGCLIIFEKWCRYNNPRTIRYEKLLSILRNGKQNTSIGFENIGAVIIDFRYEDSF
jgi:hypothetical protein